MKGKTANYLYSALVFSVLYTVANVSLAQNLDQAQALCSDLTPAKKAMAESAGYDVDQLCSQASSTSRKTQVTAPLPTIPRATVSTSAASGQFSFDQQVANDGSLPQFEADNGADKNIEPRTEAEIEKSLLKPYGYDLFANAPSTFAPTASLSVSSDYLLGPGDSLDILFYGKTNNSFSLEINREGIVDFPQLGPVTLAGLTYAEAKAMLKSRIAQQIVGAQVSISMGTLRSMQIFVLGEAFKPGAYTVSSLATVTQALISSGGVSDIGSLRNIQIKRQGMVVATLDLYDLLMRGDTANDLRLRDSDVIYIPTVGDQVSIMGEVLRPAIYELKGSETAGDLIALAGGLVATSYAKSTRLDRIDENGFLTVLDVDLTLRSDASLPLKAGDRLAVDSVTDHKKSIVTVVGAVRHEGAFSWTEGLKISDIIASREMLGTQVDTSLALLVRELENGADIEIIYFEPAKIFLDNGSKENLRLHSRDRLVFFSMYGDRSKEIAPYVQRLKRQARQTSLAPIVTVGGMVRFPGEYPFFSGMVLKDLITISGGLTEGAYAKGADIARSDISNPDQAENSVIFYDMEKDASKPLMPLDFVEFRTLPNYRERQSIALEGEFVFPGVYDFEIGETLSSVIRRAGGFTDQAFIGGSIFLRESLKKREQEEIKRLTEIMTRDLQFTSPIDFGSAVGLNQPQAQLSVIDQLSSLQPLGRLVVPLADVLNSVSDDLVLEKGDRLMVPSVSQEITVVGEVHRPTSFFFNEDFTRDDYISMSGGLRDSADKKGIYIVRANGEVLRKKSAWFRYESEDNLIAPGDTIIVPFSVNDPQMKGIPLLTQVSQIIYQLSLGAAAVNSFRNN